MHVYGSVGLCERVMAELQTKLVANDGLPKMGGERNGLTSEEAKKRLEVGDRSKKALGSRENK